MGGLTRKGIRPRFKPLSPISPHFIIMECEICKEKINVDFRALKLCDKHFDEKCENCGHKRAQHVHNDGTCIFEHSLNHKTRRGEFCSCDNFL